MVKHNGVLYRAADAHAVFVGVAAANVASCLVLVALLRRVLGARAAA